MEGKKRIVIVTGAESGIGAACAVAFGEMGDRVAVFFHSDGDQADVTVRSITGAGGQAIPVQCSVEDQDSVDAAFSRVEAEWGPAEVLINSAGVNMSGLRVRDMDIAVWDRVVDTDLTGAFLTSRRFLNALADGAQAAIVHISSIHARAVRAGGAGYCAAKGGLANLVRTLAVEEADRGVRVNGIEPGMILTPMNRRAMDDESYRRSLEGNIPMGRAGRPEEIAAVARWLASKEAGYVTGANIVVDGGLSLLMGVGA